MHAAVRQQFASPPSVLRAYAKLLLTRKPAQVPDGSQVPRLEAVLERFRVDPAHLERYRAVCRSEPAGEELPIAYPHVIAMPLHLAILTADAFPVRAPGLVHVRNRIHRQRPMRADETFSIRAWLEGHRNGARGSEFDLMTEVRSEGELVWTETCTYVARRRGRPLPGAQRSGTDGSPPSRPGATTRAGSFRVAADIGRRYARVSWDFNPIHLAGFAARLFGFPRAIAHGMWLVARCAAEIGADRVTTPCNFDISFRLPLLLPAAVALETWESGAATGFLLRDIQAHRTHLSGTLGPAL